MSETRGPLVTLLTQKRILIGLVVFTLALVLYAAQMQPSVPFVEAQPITASSTQSSQSDYLSDEETFSVTWDFIDMLHSLYYISISESAENSEDMTMFMSELLKENNELESVISSAEKYSGHSNERVRLASAGLSLGATSIRDANNALLMYLRSLGNFDYFDSSEFSYQLASYQAQEKEGYKTVIYGAAALMYLFYEPAASENPSGPLPYIMSDKHRKDLIGRIDELFGDAFIIDDYQHATTDTRNAVILAVRSIKEQLTPNTYEEAALISNE